MKKKIISVLMSVVMLFGVCSLSSCGIGSRFESDGKFEYYYKEDSDGYSIVEIKERGYSDPLYFPAYYRGKPIVDLGYYKATLAQPIVFYPDLNGIKKMYFPFGYSKMIEFVSTSEIYIVSTTSIASYQLFSAYDEEDIERGIELEDIYITSKRYNELRQEIIDENELYFNHWGEKKLEYNIFDWYLEIRLLGLEVDFAVVKIANTSYMFNYENAPNEGYFFINNFENGALIENTPYEPLREGYVFDGWYKEAECINKCNFETDIYVEQYDENGELIFNELKLYAKWIKS